MSGQKVSYVQITDREYSRFMNSAREVENIESRVQYQLERQENSLRSDFNNQMNQLKQKSKKQESNIKRLDNKIENLIESIEAKEADKRHQAKAWLDEAQSALEAIDSFRHEKFCPNEYAKLQQSYELSKQNIENEVYEASISTSQKLWQEACELKAKLELLESEWNSNYEQAVDANLQFIATCDAQTSLELAFEVEDGETSMEVDIDYWCNGELSKLKQYAQEQKKMLNSSETLSVDNFKEMMQESSKLKCEAEALTQKAKDAIILSQFRSEMANDIVESLDESGFELVDSCFKGDDERKAIHLKLQNISGDEVVTIISPQNNHENKLDIHFFDDSDEAFKKRRLQSMMQRLSNNGVECQAPQCAEGTEHHSRGNESVRDFEKVKSKQRG